MLKLLDHIISFDPLKLSIFSAYQQNVASSLTKETNPDDIEITLKAAKKSLESSFCLIQENHQNLSTSVFNAYTVTACFSGAFSNLQSILEHFDQNNIINLIFSAKKKLLQTLIFEFLRATRIEMPAGNEIHLVNGLYNLFADLYGCPTEVDHMATREFHENIISNCRLYLKRNFIVPNFIKIFTTMVPMPPETTLNNAELLSEVDTFFRFLGIDNKEKEHLYMLDDDYVHLIPKPNFSTYLQCIIISALEKMNYLKNTYWNLIPRINLMAIDIGKELVGQKKDENGEPEYFKLDEEIIESILQEEGIHPLIRLRLVKNSPSRLYAELTQLSDPNFKKCGIALLLQYQHLPQEIIISLFNLLFNDSELKVFKKIFAAYVYNRFYPLEKELLNRLAEKLTNVQCKKYIDLIYESEPSKKRYDYIEALINKAPLDILDILEISNKLIYKSVHRADFNLFNIVLKLAYTPSQLNELNELRDPNGNTFLHLLISENMNANPTQKENAAKILDELVRYGVNLNSFDRDGRSAIQIAFLYERNPMFLRKLHSLGAILNITDENGEKIIDLDDKSLNNLLRAHKFIDHNRNPNINWKKVLNPKMKKGQTLAHCAAKQNNVDFLMLINQYQISLDTKDCYLEWAPVFQAVKNKNKEAFCALAELGADLQTTDKHGNTLAHQICKDRDFNIQDKTTWLTLIAQHGAKLDQKNNKQYFPQDILLHEQKANKKFKEISIVIDRLIKEQNMRSNESAATDNVLGVRSPSMLAQFDGVRASKVSKRQTEDTIHPPSPSNGPQP